VLYLTREHGFSVLIDYNTLSFRQSGDLLFTATCNSNNAAYLNGRTVPPSELAQPVSTLPLELTLWHRCFGHINHSAIKQLVDQKLVKGMDIASMSPPPDPISEPCIAGKQCCPNVP
jgi:hypothetical protein